jgi:hypothetical protein
MLTGAYGKRGVPTMATSSIVTEVMPFNNDPVDDALPPLVPPVPSSGGVTSPGVISIT